MIKKTTLAAAALVLFATPAFAAHCPKDAKAIEAALGKSSMSDAKKTEIAALKDKGMKLHSDGKHRESESVLAEAMRMILTAN